MTSQATRRGFIAKQCVCCGSSDIDKQPAILMPFVAHRALGWEPVVIDESWGLKTVRQGSAYSVCNSLYCRDCGFVFLDIRFSDSELASLYHAYREEEYTELRERYEPGYKARNDGLNAGMNFMDEVESFIAPHLSFPAKILDWGGDTGKNSPFRHGENQIDIYEISDKETLPGTRRVSEAELKQTHYDLIVSSHVLEHVPYPGDLIADMVSVMNEKTLLYIELPYEDIMNAADHGGASPYGKKRHWHEHINFFSGRSLEKLLEANGIEQIAYRELNMKGGANCQAVFQILCRRKPKDAAQA